jgi:hypothetical protein
MKMILFFILFFLIGIVPVNAIDSSNNSGNLVATYGDGKLFQYGSLFVVELHGNYREMGRQYGALRKDVLNDIYDRISNNPAYMNMPSVFRKSNESNVPGPTKLQLKFYEPYPNYNDIMVGIGETSGLGNNTYLISSPFKEYYIAMKLLSMECSYAAAWGPYTPNGSLIAGRNYDMGQPMANYSEIIVFNPDDGSIPVATMGYIGSIYLESGLNKNGLFVEFNEGSYPAYLLQTRNDSYIDSYERHSFLRTITGSENSSKSNLPQLEIFKLVQNSSNITEFDSGFATANNYLGLVLNVADKTGSYSYEWMPYRYVKRSPQENGLITATNHFIDPSWGLEVPEPGSSEDSFDTVLRMDNLLHLSENNKGNITPEVMMQIMATPLENGGALVPQTAYQMVVVPQDLKVWFRVPRSYNWTEVDLKNHFS